MSGIEKSRSLHNFKYHDEVHLEKKQIKAISTNINDFSSTGITQTSYSSTFPKTNQRNSNISRGHHGECHFKDRRARREKGLGMEEGEPVLESLSFRQKEGEQGQATMSNVGWSPPPGSEAWSI